MIRVGKRQSLPIIQMESFGAYLGEPSQKVLLPKKQLPPNAKIGDVIDVFVYKDSEDRLISTVREAKVELGQIGILQVKQVTKIGAFLDWGLEKDLLLPFSSQTEKVEEGLFYPVALYEDKSGRLAATMWIDRYLKATELNERTKEKALIRMRTDAENVYVQLVRMGGATDYDDKADPERIKKDFGLSKNAFKKAVGILYKAGRVVIKDGAIEVAEA